MERKFLPVRLSPAELAERQFTEALPAALVSVLERRYLSEFQPENWLLSARQEDHSPALLREVMSLGRPQHPGQWAQAMPHILTACQDPGHALVMALRGGGDHHRLYIGCRRLVGAGARSTEDYLLAQESAFKAHLSGLKVGAVAKLDGEEMPEMATFLQTAPSLAVMTGIPSRRKSNLPIDFQSLDAIVRAVGNHQYTLLVVAEPLAPWIIDQTLDRCRHLKSEIHTYIRRTMSRSRGGSEGESRVDPKEANSWKNNLPLGLYGLAVFCNVAGTFLAPGIPNPLTSLASAFQSAGMGSAMAGARNMPQRTTNENWSEADGGEVLDATAEACSQILDNYIGRLQSARSGGWWRTAVYIAAESDASLHSVSGALRSMCSGEATALDPIRTLTLPDHLLRNAVAHGQILALEPAGANQSHPLGQSFNALATCINSEELSVLVSIPQREIPGLPMRDHGDYALSVPAATKDSIRLGALQDETGRDLGDVTLTAASLNRHVFVTGIIGSGKTNTCMQMLLEAYDKLNVPFLVIEPAKAEYRSLAPAPQMAGQLRIYSMGGDSPLPFRLNPLSPLRGVPLGRHIDLLKAVFNASFPMFAGMTYVLEEALLEVYAERGWSLYTSKNRFLSDKATLDERSALTPNLEDLHDKIEVVLQRKKYGQEIQQNLGAALRSRLHSLMVGNKGLALNTSRSTPPEELFTCPAVIELQNLGDDEEKAFVMALLCVLLYEYAEVRQRDLAPKDRGKLQHLTLVEEAHRLLQAPRGTSSPEAGDPRGKAVAMFTDMLAEIRAYGEGFIIADQIPTKLAPETLKNTNLKIVHRLVAPDDRQAAGSCMNLNDWQTRHLNNLPQGIAVVHDERIGEAVLTRVNFVKDGGTLEEMMGESHTSRAVTTSEKLYLYRHAGCRSCPSPCDFYHQLGEIGAEEELSASLQPFLESLLIGDLGQSWSEWIKWRAKVSQSQATARDGESQHGILYCAATQAAYRWLGQLLSARHKVRTPEGQLTPPARLRREVAARALGAFFRGWLEMSELQEPGRAIYDDVRGQLISAVATAPPLETDGCQHCPGRCLMLPFVSPHLPKTAKQVGQMVLANQNAQACLLAIERVTAPLEKTIGFLCRQKSAKEAHRNWLYCLVANTELPDAGAGKRGEILDLLRHLPDDSATEVLGIFGSSGEIT